MERLTTLRIRRTRAYVYHVPSENPPRSFAVKLPGDLLDFTHKLTQPERDSVLARIKQVRAKGSRHV